MFSRRPSHYRVTFGAAFPYTMVVVWPWKLTIQISSCWNILNSNLNVNVLLTKERGQPKYIFFVSGRICLSDSSQPVELWLPLSVMLACFTPLETWIELNFKFLLLPSAYQGFLHYPGLWAFLTLFCSISSSFRTPILRHADQQLHKGPEVGKPLVNLLLRSTLTKSKFILNNLRNSLLQQA